ncbi:MAG: ABC transporter ATP-binding protein [Candidatus Kapaibacteriales bacterium]
MAEVSVNNVSKKFGKTLAVDNVSFEATSGKILGILGPNGAGKTTTLRIIAGVLFPDSGEIEIFGRKSPVEVQMRLGYLPEERGLYKKLTILEQLVYFAELKGVNANIAKKTAVEWLSKVDAKDLEKKKIQDLSKGMQQKIQFIATLIHDPDLIILDEPFSGFDPINVEIFKNVILEQKALGKTIILSTHIMEQAEQLCDDVCLINHGQIILSDNLRKIKSNFGRDTIICEFLDGGEYFQRLSNIRILSWTENRIEFRINKENVDTKRIVNDLLQNVNIVRFELNEPSLREIFIEQVTKTGGFK